MTLSASPDDRGLRLDQFLARHIDSLTRSQIQLLNRSGAIRINGRQEKSGYRIRGDETIEVNPADLQPPTLEAEHIPLQIHFEDEHIAIIEKPAGMVVHPGAGARTGTLVHGLLYHLQHLSDAGEEGRPGIVHRLDKWTSGLLIVAKTNVAHARLSEAFLHREIQKKYVALVHGRINKGEGAIDFTIGRHPSIRTRMAAKTAKGRTAYTEYRVLKHFKEFTLLDVQIRTGRTHQIRVHLSAIGHPVVGDDVYGERRDAEFAKQYGGLERYFLHAAELRFTHPVSGDPMAFHSDLPVELQNLLKRINS